MSKQNNYDTEKIKRGIKLVCKTLSEKNFVDAQSNKCDKDIEIDDYVSEDDNRLLTISFPKSITININCKISRNSSKTARDRELDEEEREYRRALKNCARSGGFYM